MIIFLLFELIGYLIIPISIVALIIWIIKKKQSKSDTDESEDTDSSDDAENNDNK